MVLSTGLASAGPMSTGLATLHIPSTADRVYDQLWRLIVSGSLEPGEPLNEKHIGEQLGVSRSPVREALQRLVSERLVIARPNRTVTVREYTDEDIAEIYDARIVIESHAAATVISAGPATISATCDRLEDALGRLGAALGTGDRLEIVEADLAFHQDLVRCGGNSRLADAYLLLSAETVTCMSWLENARPSGGELMQDHRELVDALRARDPVAMAQAIAQHLNHASANLSAASPTERSPLNPAPVPNPRQETP